MQSRILISIVMSVTMFLAGLVYADNSKAQSGFAGQDLYLSGDGVAICKSEDAGQGKHVLIFEKGFSMSIGAKELQSSSAVVWLETLRSDYRGSIHIDYNATVYLQGNVLIKHLSGTLTTDMGKLVVEHGQTLLTRFLVSGQVFTTAQEHHNVSEGDLEEMALYQRAKTSLKPVRLEPRILKEAMVPELEQGPLPRQDLQVPQEKKEPKKSWFDTDLFKKKPATEPEHPVDEVPQDEGIVTEQSEKEPQFEYPVNFSRVAENVLVEDAKMEDAQHVTTVTGRVYFWQKRDEKGTLLELQADNAVVFHSQEKAGFEEDSHAENVLSSGSVEAIYLRGNIIMTEQGRTIRADELYYDVYKHQALAVNAEIRNFDEKRGLPVYLRASELRQVSDNVFHGDEIILTTSEFYIPQIAMHASKVVMTDTTGIDARTGKKVTDSSYDAIMYKTEMKFDQKTFFYWPKLRSNLQRPDIPLRRLEIGRDSEYGMSVESRWHLASLLGRKQPEGVDSTLAVDYFGKRGMGAGVDIDYRKQNYYGSLIGYILQDRGEDDLGDTSDRKNVEPDSDLRGRLRFRHKHFLPYDWQATIETGYASDQNFLEWFYRSEFDTGKEQETLIHLKRLKDNWAFSFLNKIRINDFEAKTEELPTIGYYMKGQSFWDNRLTYYTDTQISRMRNRLGKDDTSGASEDFYSFVTTRHEVDMPLMWNTLKIVPFVAGSYVYEDRNGYFKDLNNATIASEDESWLGEAGLRMATMFWKQDDSVRSKLWDINGIRHIVKPHFEVVAYHDNDKNVEMRNMTNLGLSQRWQTHRGSSERLRTIEWMRFDIDATWVRHNETIDSTFGPAKYIWNDPSVSLLQRRSSSYFGMLRDSVNADYTWRLSDTTTIRSDLNYDIRSGVVQQFNMGVSRYVYPDLSYYLGNRYLRSLVVNVPADNIYEQGSNAFIMAITYALSPRYTATFSQEYNFDYMDNVRSEITIARRYHRMCYGLTFFTDKSLDRSAVIFSIWPQGIKEMAFGSRKHIGLTGAMTED